VREFALDQILCLHAASVRGTSHYVQSLLWVKGRPSQADLRITQRLKDALELVEVRVLDHIIVGEGEGTSFAERGLL